MAIKKGNILNPPTGAAKKIVKEVRALTRLMIGHYEFGLQQLFSGVPDAQSANAILSNLSDKFDSEFTFAGKKWAGDIVEVASVASEVQLRLSLKEGAEFLTLPTTNIPRDMFAALTQENAELFKTIPEKFHDAVQSAVMQSIVEGKGYKDLKPFFELHSDGTLNYAHLRTMDQTRKAFNTLSAERMKALGIEEFEWMHSGGSAHPRKLHQDLNGKIFRFDNLPFLGVMYGLDVYGLPGKMINCRCRMRPIIL